MSDNPKPSSRKRKVLVAGHGLSAIDPHLKPASCSCGNGFFLPSEGSLLFLCGHPIFVDVVICVTLPLSPTPDPKMTAEAYVHLNNATPR